MKLPNPNQNRARRQGFILLLVLIIVSCSLLALSYTLKRTSAVSILNQRYNQLIICDNAAEAAVEKDFARMAYDFQQNGVLNVTNNLGLYATNIPTATENPYWTNFIFTDAQGNTNRTYAAYAYSYSGPLPSSYTGLFTSNAPVYRLVSNVTMANSSFNVTGTAQEDILLGLVPLTTWAIFYNGLLEFSTCAAMTVNGRVQANGSIYVGSSSTLTFNSGVSTTGTLTSPANNGDGPWTSKNWNVNFNGSPQYTTNVASVTVSLNMTNSHFLIDIPPSTELATSITGEQRLYNLAQMLLIVSNAATGTTSGTNATVYLTLQQALNGNEPGDDPGKITYYYSNAAPATLMTGVTNADPNLPFLSLTNTFYDQREDKTDIVSQVDVGLLAKWAATNTYLLSKLNSTNGTYPTILYVADLRSSTPSQLDVVRLNDAIQLPYNNGYGFSVATPNPLYVWGDYNTQTNATGGSSASSTNTPAYAVPAALLSDALTVLSSNWTDSQSYTAYSASSSADYAAPETIDAAIVTGTMPSTGTNYYTNSGGVHNLPRLLENWDPNSGQIPIYLNTSILRLWTSNMATNQFRDPSNFGLANNPYYDPPKRYISFNQNFLNAASTPPGIPVVLMPLRFAWYQPPPGVVTNTPAHD